MYGRRTGLANGAPRAGRAAAIHATVRSENEAGGYLTQARCGVGGRAAALWLSALDSIAEARRRRGVARPGASDHEGTAVASAASETKTPYVLEAQYDKHY